MNIEDDGECTADYGVFGNLTCNCSSCNPAPRILSDADRKAIDRANREREQSRKTNSGFNRAMIDLYNARHP